MPKKKNEDKEPELPKGHKLVKGVEWITQATVAKMANVTRPAAHKYIISQKIRKDSRGYVRLYDPKVQEYINRVDHNRSLAFRQKDPNDNDDSGQPLSVFEAQEAYLIAQAQEKKEKVKNLKLKNARERGELIDRELVYKYLFLYLDKLHSNIERGTQNIIEEIILKYAVSIKAKDKMKLVDQILTVIDDTKILIVKNLSKIENEGEAE